MIQTTFIIFIGFFALLILMIIFFMLRYKRCPPDQLLIVSGVLDVENPDTEKYKAHKSNTFVWPVIQDSFFLPLGPYSLSLKIPHHLSGGDLPFEVRLSEAPSQLNTVAELYFKKDKSTIHKSIKKHLKVLEIELLNSKENPNLDQVKESLKIHLQKVGAEVISF